MIPADQALVDIERRIALTVDPATEEVRRVAGDVAVLDHRARGAVCGLRSAVDATAVSEVHSVAGGVACDGAVVDVQRHPGERVRETVLVDAATVAGDTGGDEVGVVVGDRAVGDRRRAIAVDTPSVAGGVDVVARDRDTVEGEAGGAGTAPEVDPPAVARSLIPARDRQARQREVLSGRGDVEHAIAGERLLDRRVPRPDDVHRTEDVQVAADIVVLGRAGQGQLIDAARDHDHVGRVDTRRVRP